ncbi:MFS transporter [Microbacterium sp. NEAU-LLC]|uniref:MFS transporter n=1 Tax=Microbacterium helvum TaxID=2773713 RepID=A0ABR8NQ58_9MICO|nr:MFS transporter [Microbacterium helvum]MBD3942784.1 MFS transporter [Microbacterium helvum]
MNDSPVPQRLFALFWTGNALATTGSEIFRFAVGIIAVDLLVASPFELGVLGAVTFAGILLLSPIAGAVTDRRARRAVLLATVTARILLMILVPAAYLVDGLSIWILIGLVAALSLGDVFYDAAHFSVVTELVPRELVSTAVGRLQTADQVARIAVPGAAGIAVRFIAAPVVTVFAALFQAGALLMFRRLPRTGRPSDATARQPFRETVRAGFAFIGQSLVIRTFMLSSGILNLAAGVVVAVLTLFSLRTLGLSPAEYGIAMGIGAAGGVVAGIVAARIGEQIGQIRTMVIAAAGIPLAYAVLLTAPVIPVPAVVSLTVAELLFSFLILLYGIQNAGLSARVTPSALMGRVASARRLVAVGSFPVGSLLGGLIAQWWGVETALAAALVISLCITLPIVLSGLARRASLPDEYAAIEDRGPA